MINNKKIEEIKSATIKNLEEIIKGIDKIIFEEHLSYKFNTKDIQNNEYIDNCLQKIKNQINHNKYKYIYTFRLPAEFPADKIDIIYNKYSEAKKSKKAERAYARLNKNTQSRYLYVGSSKKLIYRIKQHLGYGPKGTYAMQLCHWWEDFKDIEIEIALDIYAFDNNISDKAFQAFEDGAWNLLKPIFGRQGKR